MLTDLVMKAPWKRRLGTYRWRKILKLFLANIVCLTELTGDGG
jgi:hypothetical protein